MSVHISILYYVSIYLYASTFIFFFSFLHVRTFKIYFSYNFYRLVRRLHFVSICYIYQLTHVTSPCLALLAYRFIKTLNRITAASSFLLRSHFLRLRRRRISIRTEKKKYLTIQI